MLYLEFARRHKKMSQQALGIHPLVRLDHAFIGQIERGNALPTPDQAARLAHVLGISVDLLTQEAPLPPLPEPLAADGTDTAR